ncbi:MAG: geranylgeranyl reductase family protein [Nitrospirae bacterium]|nr:geranylgeranyl reductase family protein [Nitrospirota bacterium]
MRVEVLVVGGGPAGAMAARRLAENQKEVLIVERELMRLKPCGGGIPSTAFQDLDIPLRVKHVSVNKIRIYSPSDRVLEIALEGGSIILVNRREFDSCLRDIALSAGAGLVVGTLTDIKKKKKSLIASIKTSQKVIEVEADYLIAADGINSKTRFLMSIKPNQYVYTLSGKLEDTTTDVCEFWFSQAHAPRGYSWVFPSMSGVSIGTGTFEPKEAREYFKRFLIRRFKDDDLLKDIKQLRGYKVPYWSENTYYKDRVFFVGDAGGHVMPFTFEGIYYSMKSGAFAAQAIIEGRPSLFKKLWRKRFYSRFRLMKAIQEYFLKSDDRFEQLFNLFQRKDVQEVSMLLWLRKDSSKSSIIRYINFFRKFLH